jgi:hypothetical protein
MCGRFIFCIVIRRWWDGAWVLVPLNPKPLKRIGGGHSLPRHDRTLLTSQRRLGFQGGVFVAWFCQAMHSW